MKTNEELLGRLFDAVVEDLLGKIKSGEAKPSEIASAIKLLADNGIQCLPQANPQMINLKELLPGGVFGGPGDQVQ
jgi:hypothetical protein